ncbi:DMT family transporter [Fictibacillus barbaricus]|uniref:EamA family transporter n=1 Tax=Fictibacillus barbaricus TaxID=182136 RepID=A0ABS2Z8S8_9BACL|nr:EamA family transporter [Fictibacillus barbaricus]MBN3543957.1 EamA family transporter [Fictibacillus barbaricus]GGB69947.1 transporter [Fictibacillus barbaricus]
MIIVNFILMCLIFGTTFLAIKVGVDGGLPPFFSAGIRFFTAGCILYFIMMLRKKGNLSVLLSKESFITGSTLTFGTFSTLYWAEQYVTSGMGAVLSATGPLMILLIQTLVLRIRLSKQSLVGCIISFIGVIMLLLPNLNISKSYLLLLSCLLILLGQLAFASGTLYSKKVSERFSNSSPILLNASQMIHGGILLLVLSLFSESISVEQLTNHVTIGSLLYLTVFGSMIAHTLYYWLVKNTDPVFPSTWLYISPLIAIGLGTLIYNEYVSWIMVTGGLTIVLGLIIINVSNLEIFSKKARVHQREGL